MCKCQRGAEDFKKEENGERGGLNGGVGLYVWSSCIAQISEVGAKKHRYEKNNSRGNLILRKKRKLIQ